MGKAFVLLICLCVLKHSAAQEPHYRHFSVSDGLPSSEVYTSFQDSKGYLWFATDRGVSRFDGYTFKNYTTADGLSDNTVFGFFEDHLHRIWLRSYSGQLSYIYGDKAYQYAPSSALIKNFRSDIVVSLYVDREENIWMGMRYQGILKLDKQGILSQEGEQRNNTLRIMKKDRHKWFGLLRGSGNQSAVYENISVHLGKKYLDIGLVRSNLICYSALENNHLLSIGNQIFYFSDSLLIRQVKMKEQVIYLYADSQKRIWVCTYNGVICYRDSQMRESEAEYYFKGHSVSSVMEDREGNYWFTSLEKGVYLMQNQITQTYLSADIGKITTLSLCDSTIWVGTSQSKLYAFRNKKMETYTLPGPKTWVNCILKEKDGKILVGTDHMTYSLSHGKITNYSSIRSKFISSDAQGRIWIAAYSSIYCIKGYGPPLRGKVNFIYSFLPDGDTCWIGTSTGLVRWDRKSNELYDMKEVSPSFSNRISAIAKDHHGTFYFSTHGSGLIIWKGEKILQLTTFNGLPRDICNHVYIDDENYLWVSTNKGVARVGNPEDPSRRKIKIYDKQDGLISNEVYQVVRFRNDLWVATSEGLNVVHLGGTDPLSVEVPVYITSVSVDNNSYPPESSYRLPYDHKYFRIHFLGLKYKNAGHTLYRYKMQGLDADWIYTSVPQVQYTTLPAGQYVFYVSAANKNGEWNKVPVFIKIQVDRPFWNTTWFFVLAFSGITCILYFAFRERARRKIARSELLKELNAQKHKALSAQLNPHFIFNSLNSVQHYVLNSDDKKLAGKYISAFASLMRATLDNSQHVLLPLSDEIQALELYLKLESMRFSDRFSFRIDIGPGLDTGQIRVPSLLFQPYVENAIWHGLLHKEGKGSVVVTIRQEENKLFCSIEDNGIGRAKAALIRNNKGTGHKSAGLSLTQNRLELINSIYKSNIILYIEDLKDRHGEPAGTRINLTMPLFYPESTYVL